MGTVVTCMETGKTAAEGGGGEEGGCTRQDAQSENSAGSVRVTPRGGYTDKNLTS